MPERPPLDREVPEGYELVAVPAPEWRLVTGKRCRYGAGFRHRACGEPSVAELDRRAWRSDEHRPNWWAYCPAHLFGRWVEDGQVMHWILRKQEDSDS